MRAEKTWELRISFETSQDGLRTKELVKAWLMEQGVDSFVEGVVDSLDLDHEFGLAETADLFERLGGDTSPVSVYKYSREALEDLQARADQEFHEKVKCSLHEMETKQWLDGWKDSFKAFATERFFVFPPWDRVAPPDGKIPLEIEPASAFGTGQHATTRLCMGLMEKISSEWIRDGVTLSRMSLLDVGTGTGILAIGGQLLGFGEVRATDIDDDAVVAARQNAAVNGLDLRVTKESVPEVGEQDLVLANILAVVLGPMLPKLARVTRRGTGRLVLSGILAEEAETMVELARAQGLDLVARETMEDWAGLTFQRTR